MGKALASTGLHEFMTELLEKSVYICRNVLETCEEKNVSTVRGQIAGLRGVQDVLDLLHDCRTGLPDALNAVSHRLGVAIRKEGDG